LFTTEQPIIMVMASASTYLFLNSRDCVPKIHKITLTIASSDQANVNGDKILFSTF